MENQDEPHLPGRRVQRPESRNSSAPRSYTPQSSTSSTTNAQSHHSGRGSSERIASANTEVSQTGSLLQERLREKKAAMYTERKLCIDGDRAIQSSPVRNGFTSRQSTEREQRRPGSSGKSGASAGKKGMGVKDMEEANNTLHKQNFDLKLELFHRRQRQTALEEKLEAAEARAAEQEEMQAVNEQLLSELQKRDQAVEEAVAMICKLEEDIERLIQERNFVKSFDADYESSYISKSHTEFSKDGGWPSSPPQLTPVPRTVAGKLKVSQRSIARMPSFLSEQNEGTEALRSLYLPRDTDGSMLSLPKLLDKSEQEEDEDQEGMNSPRLSVLSESSFLSVYGEKTLSVEALDLNSGSVQPDRGHRKASSIDKWIADGGRVITVPHQGASPTKAHLTPRRNIQPLSINTILESPLQRLEKLERQLNRVNNATSKQPSVASARKIKTFDPRSSDSSHTLPPTPDTVSTSTLRLYKNSSSTLAQDFQSFETRRTPRPSPSTINEEFRRPKSAGGTITSRREGHGWDTTTVSSSSLTTGDNNTEGGESFDPWLAAAQDDEISPPVPQHRDLAQGMWEHKQKALAPPDMFSFSAMHDEPDFTNDELGIYDDEPQAGQCGASMMLSENTDLDIPSMTRHLQRLGVCEEPRSDDTVIANSYEAGSKRASLVINGPVGEDRSSSPLPPPRRSSLGNGGRLRKERRKSTTTSAATSPGPQTRRPTYEPAQSTPAPPVVTPTKQTARNRITSKLFGRSESFPSPSTSASTTATPSSTSTTPATHTYAGALQASQTSPSSSKRRQNLPRSQTYHDFPQSRPGRPRSGGASAAIRNDHNLNPLRRPINAHAKKLSVDVESIHSMASATPPPIARYPRAAPQPNPRVQMRRPSSAGNSAPVTTGSMSFPARFGANRLLLGSRARRQSHSQPYVPDLTMERSDAREDLGAGSGLDFGVDGAGDEKEQIRPVTVHGSDRKGSVSTPPLSNNGGKKKWLGLGRVGSVTRR